MGLLLSKLSELYESFGDTQMRILMLGLDAAGKTTIMYKLKLNESVSTIPTIGFNVETVTPKKGLTFTIWDLGGQTRLRALWKHYFENTQGLIYVIDSNDCDRFSLAYVSLAYDELDGILSDDAMRGVPVVVLANKQDLPNAASTSDIADTLKLHKLRDRNWHIQATSGVNGEGVYEAMDILGDYTKEFKRSQRF